MYAIWRKLLDVCDLICRLFPLHETSLFRSKPQRTENILVTSSRDHSIRLWWKVFYETSAALINLPFCWFVWLKHMLTDTCCQWMNYTGSYTNSAFHKRMLNFYAFLFALSQHPESLSHAYCRIPANDVLKVTMVQLLSCRINCLVMAPAEYWPVGGKMLLFVYGLLAQVENEANKLWRLHFTGMRNPLNWCQLQGMSWLLEEIFWQLIFELLKIETCELGFSSWHLLMFRWTTSCYTVWYVNLFCGLGHRLWTKICFILTDFC